VGDKERYRQAGADTEATNGLGQTALHIAAARGELNICRALLRAGAGADRRAADGSVALAVAAAAGQAGAVRLLAAVRVCHPAIRVGRMWSLTSVWAQAGAAVDPVDGRGRSALAAAVGGRLVRYAAILTRCAPVPRD
jgi:ankyrin repeat protein